MLCCTLADTITGRELERDRGAHSDGAACTHTHRALVMLRLWRVNVGVCGDPGPASSAAHRAGW